MLFDIVHRMDFIFENPVFFDPMTLRMRPRTDAAQTLLSFRTESVPPPARDEALSDLEGNTETRYWFEGPHTLMSFEAVSRVRTFRHNPFAFLFFDTRAQILPFSYPARLSPLLAPFQRPGNPESIGPRFQKFADDIRRESKMETLSFLTFLSRYIPEQLAKETREEGSPQSPEETLKKGSGSCRDFAVLAMEVCRSCQIAARFTSGYYLPSGAAAEPSLHGWIEVYLPEIGWRGLDPSEGLLTADRHIALASSFDPILTLPTEGTYRGSGSSVLKTSIRIDLLPATQTQA